MFKFNKTIIKTVENESQINQTLNRDYSKKESKINQITVGLFLIPSLNNLSLAFDLFLIHFRLFLIIVLLNLSKNFQIDFR